MSNGFYLLTCLLLNLFIYSLESAVIIRKTQSIFKLFVESSEMPSYNSPNTLSKYSTFMEFNRELENGGIGSERLFK